MRSDIDAIRKAAVADPLVFQTSAEYENPGGVAALAIVAASLLVRYRVLPGDNKNTMEGEKRLSLGQSAKSRDGGLCGHTCWAPILQREA